MSARGRLGDNPGMDEERVLAFPRAPDAIELRHLRSFVAVAEELNFGRAAEQLYLSQPALSRQIRALEQFVGVELFRRSTHQVELTLAGEALLDRAREHPARGRRGGLGDPVGRRRARGPQHGHVEGARRPVRGRRRRPRDARRLRGAARAVRPAAGGHRPSRQRGRRQLAARLAARPARDQHPLPARRRLHARLRVRLPASGRRARARRRRRRARRRTTGSLPSTRSPPPSTTR